MVCIAPFYRLRKAAPGALTLTSGVRYVFQRVQFGLRAAPALGLRRRAAVVGLGLTALGCFNATFTDARHPASEEHRSAFRSHFLFGLVGGTDVDVRDYCRSGQAHEVRTYSSFGTMTISLVTLGIYTPRMVRFTCVAPPPAVMTPATPIAPSAEPPPTAASAVAAPSAVAPSAVGPPASAAPPASAVSPSPALLEPP